MHTEMNTNKLKNRIIMEAMVTYAKTKTNLENLTMI